MVGLGGVHESSEEIDMHWAIRLLALLIVAVGNWVALSAMAILVLVGWRGAAGDIVSSCCSGQTGDAEGT